MKEWKPGMDRMREPELTARWIPWGLAAGARARRWQAGSIRARKASVAGLLMLFLLPGCLHRPWSYEESSRIEAIVTRDGRPVEAAALEGIAGPVARSREQTREPPSPKVTVKRLLKIEEKPARTRKKRRPGHDPELRFSGLK